MVNGLIPKIRGFPLVVNAERILQSTTDFIRGNVIVSTASVGAGVTGLVIAGATIRKLRTKKTKKRKSKRKGIKRKGIKRKRVKRKGRSKVTHRSPRHGGHKFVTFTTKGGKKVKFRVRQKAHSHRRKRR